MKNVLVLEGANFASHKVRQIDIHTESIPCTNLSLDKSSYTFTEMGNLTINATKTPTDTTDSLTWSTSNANVATVANGVVTLVGLGTATITAKCGNVTATCAITANEIGASYVVNDRGLSVGGSSQNQYMQHSANTSTTHKKIVLSASKTTQKSKAVQTDQTSIAIVPIIIPKGASKLSLKSTSTITKHNAYNYVFFSDDNNAVSVSGTSATRYIATQGVDQSLWISETEYDIASSADSCFITFNVPNSAVDEMSVSEYIASVGLTIKFKA